MIHWVKTKKGVKQMVDEHLRVIRYHGGVDTVIVTRGADGVAVSSSFNLSEDDKLFLLLDDGAKWIRNDTASGEVE